MYKLRRYQEKAVGDLRQCLARLSAAERRAILVAPTGSGKTVIASHVIERAVAKGGHVLVLAHRKELIDQLCEKLRANGVAHGVIKAGERHREVWGAPVQVASKDTLYSRAIRRGTMDVPHADLVVVDECHRSTGGKTWLSILERFQKENKVVLGLTATPSRENGRQLGTFWSEMVVAATYEELIAEGCLVPTRVVAPHKPDLKGVRTRMGDYVESDLEAAMNRTKLVGDILKTWQEHACNRPTVIFASGIAHSMAIRDLFQNAGVAIEHLDGQTDAYTRMEILAMLQQGRLQAVSNVGVLTEGTDIPRLSCAVLARPTKSLVLYRQMAGRIQRPADGKSDAIVLDHAGAVWDHGFPDDDIEWKLSSDIGEEHRAKQQKRAENTWVCDSCQHANDGGQFCKHCGAVRPRHDRKPMLYQTKPGKLAEITRAKANRECSLEEKQRYWDSCLGKAIGRKAKVGMAGHLYRARFGVWPPRNLSGVPRSTDWQLSALDFWRKLNLSTHQRI